MEMSQHVYDLYERALSDYEGIVEKKEAGWEAYAAEASKIRATLYKAKIQVEATRVLGNS